MASRAAAGEESCTGIGHSRSFYHIGLGAKKAVREAVAESRGACHIPGMASGWAPDGAVQDQIDATVDSEVARARSRLPQGESLVRCEDCGGEIPEARRRAVPGVRRCRDCQVEADAADTKLTTYNRRGNKDSQLR
jgi:phage/conjugal plasmid C-4 type zinc finger TraR family protein